jgi:CubicO group peptidase (beta-lactamase class C family)
MKAAIDKLVDSVISIPEGTGLVVCVLQNGRSLVYGYGLMGETEQPGGDTVYEIGSISKVFTTSLLAIMLNDGFLELDTSVCEILPELVNLPEELTLLSLATHTSGLPKMPSDVLPKMLRNRSNPYIDYSTQDMLRYLSRCKPGRLLKRMGRIEYSNLGIGLLGFILARKMGVPFEQIIMDRICEPLGMNDTSIRLSSDMISRLAPPRLANGKAASNWDMPAFEGAGGIRSTANDMIKFLQANVELTDLHLTKALQTCHDMRATDFVPLGPLQALISKQSGNADYTTRYRQAIGLGWVVGRLLADGRLVHWHHGATGGYRAFAGFVKSLGAGVVVLANTRPSMRDLFTSATATDVLGFEILESLCSQAQSH